MIETMPTPHDRKHITPLAQHIVDVAQAYARDNQMTFPGVMSALGTAAGGLLARAYSDTDLAVAVAERLSIAAAVMVRTTHEHDDRIKARLLEKRT